ncbi:MAG: pentapeptide repeat-containing protein [Nitrospinota bacterium]|nr:pentapeptide repeat-containing protein [Nitrospinota bacterium]
MEFIEKNPAFSDIFKNILPLILAAPIALPIWYWRDQNKKADIQNAREDLIQKDFHEIQKWAVGLGGDKNETLQIAAIHQLKPFAVGIHGERFQRPAYEIYFSLLQSWPEEEVNDETVVPNHILAIHTVFREEGSKITKKMNRINLAKADLSGADLSGVNLAEANLQSAELFRANLQSANLMLANLQSVNLAHANLQSADLSGANLQSANLRYANLQSAYLLLTNLQSTDLSGANLQSAELEGAEFEDREIIRGENWNKAEYSKGKLENLQKLYKELKGKDEKNYWDPESENYIFPPPIHDSRD